MNYTQLVADKDTAGSIKNWTNFARIDAETVLAEAESLIFTGYTAGRSFSALRVREMRSTASLTLAEGESSLALPTRFLDPILLRDITNNLKMTLRGEDWMENSREWEDDGTLSIGMPLNFAIYDEMIQFDRLAEDATNYRFLYYAKPAPLSSSATTNWLTERYPRLLRLACTAMAADFQHHTERFNQAMGELSVMIQSVNAESDLSRRGEVYDIEVP